MKRISNTQKKNIKNYTSGRIMLNNSRNEKDIIAFTFMNKHYISRDVKRNSTYSFDDKRWSSIKCSGMSKVYMIYTKIVKEVNLKEKHKIVYELSGHSIK